MYLEKEDVGENIMCSGKAQAYFQLLKLLLKHLLALALHLLLSIFSMMLLSFSM